MAAAQVNTTAAALLAADDDQHREVIVQNLGPNAIYLAVGATATAAAGIQVAAGATLPFPLKVPAGQALSAIAATALQVTPADTRYHVI